MRWPSSWQQLQEWMSRVDGGREVAVCLALFFCSIMISLKCCGHGVACSRHKTSRDEYGLQRA